MVNSSPGDSQKGIFQQIQNSIGSFIIGLLCVAGAFFLLFWNEGRSVTRAKALQEGRNKSVKISSDQPSQAKGKELVYLTGKARTNQEVTDPKFGISADGIALIRSVEMYQWKEIEKTETRRTGNGNKETITRHEYRKVWSKKLINSRHFEKRRSYRNPSSMKYEPKRIDADNVKLGKFTLPDGLVSQITSQKPVKLTEKHLQQTSEKLNQPPTIHENMYYFSKNPHRPVIGDIRIAFKRIPEATVSVIASPEGRSFQPYRTESGDELFMLREGTLSKKEMFEEAAQENFLMTWGLRLVGFLIMFAGVYFMFHPLVVFVSGLPLFGGIIGLGMGFFSGIIGLALSLVAIGISWFSYRPLIAFLSIIGALGVMFAGRMFAGSGSGTVSGDNSTSAP